MGKKLSLRVWAEVSYLVPFEVEVDEAEIDDYLGFEHRPYAPSDVERAIYQSPGLYDEVMWDMPAPDLTIHKLKNITINTVEVLDNKPNNNSHSIEKGSHDGEDEVPLR